LLLGLEKNAIITVKLLHSNKQRMKGFSMVEGVYMVKAASFIAAALVMAIGTISPAYGQGLVGAKGCENIGKYPESIRDIRTAMGLSLFMIETSAVYCLVVAIMILILGRMG
jgi:F-type H+-transporting ATPase subunit c